MIEQLQEAVSNTRGFVSMSPSITSLVRFAHAFLSTEPITEEWLREKWGFKQYGPERIALLDRAGPMICWWLSPLPTGLLVGGDHVKMNQGEFTALMFSLGQYPIEYDPVALVECPRLGLAK